MIKSCFLKLVFCMVLIMGLSCSFASAEEVDLTPDDYSILYLKKPDNSLLVQEIRMAVTSSYFPNNSELGSYTLVQPSYYLYSSNAGSARRDSVITVWGSGSSAADFNVSYTNCEIGLDMSENINGYYRYSADLYFGLGGGFTQYANTNKVMDLTPSYTYNSAPFFIGDSENGMHCTVYLVGETEYTHHSNAGSAELETFSLIHIYVESTFYYDSSYGTDVVFQIGPWFDNNISALNFDLTDFRANGTTKNFDFYANNRFKSSLVGNVDPPVTPTPTVTPYPGQDTQESINQGVSNIEGQMNQLINSLNPVVSPIPTPADFTIDETLFDELETITLPDISDTQSTYSALWDIFNPLWWIIGLMFSIVFVIGIFLYVLRGGFI